jgi:hypothetical protein
MSLAPVEERMWEVSPLKDTPQMSEAEINRKFEKAERRVLTAINREKLPSFAAALRKPGYMKISPFYQRRLRWDKKMQSRLIESLLINIPVPPIILYQIGYNSYEVIDGQQRITTIRDFYDNELKLTGLEIYPELEGRTYNQLPAKIKAGIDHRSISSIALITESPPDSEETLLLKQISFERLNTGGMALSRQEIRNCLYSGKFNELLLELASNPIFASAWGIPIDNQGKLVSNNLYKKMEDVELILRFFALRHIDRFKGNIEKFLDVYMIKSRKFSDIEILKKDFNDTIKAAYDIYGETLFKPFDPQLQDWKSRAYKAYYDAVMVGFSKHLDNANILASKKYKVIEETKRIFTEDKSGLFTGQGKTKSDLQTRIQRFDEMLLQVMQD